MFDTICIVRNSVVKVRTSRTEPLRVSLLGLSGQLFGRDQPCLAIYSLRAFAERDASLGPRVDIRVHDLSLPVTEDAVLARLRDAKPDIVGMSCYVWNISRMLRIARALRAETPTLRLFLGGPAAGHLARNILRDTPCLDGIVEGEGEEPFRLLLRRLAGLDEESWARTPGLCGRSGNEILANPPPEPPPLDMIPMAHTDPDFQHRFPAVLTMETARGCKYRCAYCGYGSQTPDRRTRSLQSIFRAIRAFSSGGGGLIVFLDPGINQDRRRFRAILRYLSAFDNVRLAPLEINLEDLREDDLVLLKQTPCDRLVVGLQTTHPPTLRAVRRRFRPEEFRRKAAQIREHGLSFSLDLIYGLPGDNYDTFKRSLDDALAMCPHLIVSFRLQVLPGSLFAREPGRWGLCFQPGPPYYLQSCSTFSGEDMRRAERLAIAGDVFHQYSYRSEILPLVARELGCTPSALLEHFLDGTWRGNLVTDEELTRWASPAGQAECLPLLRQCLEELFQSVRHEKTPRPLVDLLIFQHHAGRLKALAPLRSPPETTGWPPASEAVPGLAPSSTVIRCETDIVTLLHRLPALEAVAGRTLHFLFYIQDRVVFHLPLPPMIVHLLALIQEGHPLAEIEKIACSCCQPGDPDEIQRHVRALLRELTDRQVIVWKNDHLPAGGTAEISG